MCRTLAFAVLSVAACHGNLKVRSAEEIGVVEQSPAIVGRDGGGSGLAWGRSVWTYGDTVLGVPDERGATWHHNSYGVTSDFDASDGIGGFGSALDAEGAPAYFIAPTHDEWAFNELHQGDDCIETPCGARWAVWPGEVVFDPGMQRALVFYGLVYAEPGDFNFEGVGQGVAVWDSLDDAPTRPEPGIDPKHPTNLFLASEPDYGVAPTLIDGHLYVFGTTSGLAGHHCSLARVPVERVLDRSAWRYWDGEAWNPDISRARSVFVGGPNLAVSFDDYLGQWLAIYSRPFSPDIVARTANELTGPWSNESVLYTVPKADGEPYDAFHHPEYEEEDGRVQYVTYSRGTGGFGSEFALVRMSSSERVGGRGPR